MTKTAVILILVGVVASIGLFLGLLAGTGPAADDATVVLALDALPLSGLLADPLPEPGEGVTYRPLSALVTGLLFDIFPVPSWWWQAVLVLLLLSILYLAARVLRRIVGWAAAASAALLYAVHPVQAGFFAAPLSGLAALLPVLLVLLCMDRLALHRERSRAGSFVSSVLAMALAGLATGHVGIPLLVLAFDLSLAQGGYAQRLRHKAALQIGLFAAFGVTLLVRHLATGALPGFGKGLDDAILLLLASPFDPAGGHSWCQWCAWGFLVLCLVALLCRAVIDRRGFPAAFCKAFALLLVAVLFQTEWTDGARLTAEGFPLSLLFFSGVAGILLAGPSPLGERTRRPGPALGLSLLAAAAMGSVTGSLCLDIADADERAAAAADQMRRELVERQHTQLYLYNQPRIIRLGNTPLATFMGNDLVVRLRPAATRKGITPYPFNGHPLLSETIGIFLATRGGAIPFDLDENGDVSRIYLTHDKVNRVASTVRESGFDQPGNKSRLVLERNGFPFSFVPPPETVSCRAVLLTPLGVCTATEFDTWMRFDSGWETFFFNEEWLRRRLPLFNGGRLIAWIEPFDRSGRLIQRTPSVQFELSAGSN